MNVWIGSKVQYIANRLGYSIAKITATDTDTGRSLYDGFPSESLERRRFYNVGAGAFSHPYWTNIDYCTPWYSAAQRNPFINYDLMTLAPLPVEDNAAEIVYSSHTIEHISDDAVLNMLREAYRILKPGGVLRLTTPDMELEHAAYKHRDRHFYYWIAGYTLPDQWRHIWNISPAEATIHQLFLSHFASQLAAISADSKTQGKYSDTEIQEIFATRTMEEAFDYFTHQCRYNPERPGDHINWWTWGKATRFLADAGFSDYYKSGYGQSKAPPLRDIRLFDKTHPKISLYVEAIKARGPNTTPRKEVAA